MSRLAHLCSYMNVLMCHTTIQDETSIKSSAPMIVVAKSSKIPLHELQMPYLSISMVPLFTPLGWLAFADVLCALLLIDKENNKYLTLVLTKKGMDWFITMVYNKMNDETSKSQRKHYMKIWAIQINFSNISFRKAAPPPCGKCSWVHRKLLLIAGS